MLAAKGLTLTARIGGRDVEALRDINFELGAGASSASSANWAPARA